MLWISILIFSLLFVIGYLTNYFFYHSQLKQAEEKGKRLYDVKHKEAKKVYTDLLNDKIKSLNNYQSSEESDISHQESENYSREKRIKVFSHNLNHRKERLNKQNYANRLIAEDNQSLSHNINDTTKQAEKLLYKRSKVIEQRSGINKNEAIKEVKRSLKVELNKDKNNITKKSIEEITFNVSKEARSILLYALQLPSKQSIMGDSRIKKVITVKDIKRRKKLRGNDDMYLKLMESLGGVKLNFEEQHPEQLTINTYNPIRREITQRALTNLLNSRRINNNIIEKEFEKSRRSTMNSFRKIGEQTVKQLKLGWMHPDLMKIVGRLKYRSSYGQNMLNHSIEVAEFAGTIASELGLDATLARRAGLLHDIGKVIDRQATGTHVELGVKLATYYQEDDVVINTIASHHGDKEAQDPIAIIVAAADALSGARVGARSESAEEYLKRLSDLEEIANKQFGVKDSYAIQAGREVRIVVNPKLVNDKQSNNISEKVKKEIENNLNYPGKVKVTTIRKSVANRYTNKFHHKKSSYAKSY